MDVVLIHPPVAFPCEPPVGAAMLARRLRDAGLEVELIDASIEALDGRLSEPLREGVVLRPGAERRLQRAQRWLRTAKGYQNRDRYRWAISTIRHALAARDTGSARVGIADYRDDELSSLRSADLRRSAERWQQSPFAEVFAALAERVAERRPRLVGLSVNYLHQALPAMALGAALRERLDDDNGGHRARLLVGGALLGCWRGLVDDATFAPWFDEVAFGLGDARIHRLLGRGPAAATDPLAPPDFGGIPWARYLAPLRIAPIVTTQGCYWGRCNYCPEAATQQGFSMMPPSTLIDRIERVRREHEPGLLHLADSALPPAVLRRLAAQRWGARWYGFARFHADLADPGFARALRASGCVMLQLGLESASEPVLRRLRKGLDLAQASRALRVLHEAGVAVYLYVLFGVPGEREDDARRTRDFVAAHAPQIGYINTSVMNLPNCSPPEPDIERFPFIADNDLSLYSNFNAATGWDRRAARRYLERAFAREPSIAAILRRTLPVFGANHAPLLEMALGR